VRAWASYGDYDRLMFEQTCRALDLEYPFSPTHFNVKVLLSLALGLGHTVGLPEALGPLRLSFEGTHHRGVDDAWNIARVLAGMLRLAREGAPDRRTQEHDSPARSEAKPAAGREPETESE
jgi:inhibitor of KinA sporulation pathway (predicted exonuclease)